MRRRSSSGRWSGRSPQVAVVITGPDGHSTAVLVSAGELADLEDELAFAQHDAEKAAGTFGSVPQAEARRRLGLPVE